MGKSEDVVIESNAKSKDIEAKPVHVEHANPKKSSHLISSTAEDVKQYLIWDVIVPALKAMIVDAITKGANAIFYGDQKRSESNVRRDRGKSYVEYDRASYKDDYVPWREDRSRASRSAAAFDSYDHPFRKRETAEQVLEHMFALASESGYVTVADFYELSGKTSLRTDVYWGWHSIDGARVEERSRGWTIILPPPRQLDYE